MIDPSLMTIQSIREMFKKDVIYPVHLIATVAESVVKQTRDGDPYLEIVLIDGTGTMNARKFTTNTHLNKNKNIYAVDSVLEIHGTYERRFKSLTIEHEDKKENVTPTRIVESVVEQLDKQHDPVNVDELMIYLKGVILSIKDEFLLKLLREFFNDKTFRDWYTECPAAANHHHDYKGGLLFHVVSMLKMLDVAIEIYKKNLLDIDLLKTGVILHDIGKMRVYKFEYGKPTYINSHKKLNHSSIGDLMLYERFAKIRGFPDDLKRKLHGIMASHHGKFEWDALKEIETDEEQIIHDLDVIDARFGRRGNRNDDKRQSK